MINKKVLTFGLSVLITAGFVACQDSGSSASPAATASNPVVVQQAYTPGTAAAEYMVKSYHAVADSGASTEAELAAIYAEFPKLGRLAADVKSFDRIVMTDAGNFEFYAGTELVLAVSASGSSMTVIWAKEGFAADSISYSLIAEAQQAPHGDVTFKVNECIEQEQQQQGQEQKGKEEQQKGKEEKQPKCEGLTVVITFEGETPKQEQKGQEQEQKGKETPAPSPTASPSSAPTPKQGQ